MAGGAKETEHTTNNGRQIATQKKYRQRNANPTWVNDNGAPF